MNMKNWFGSRIMREAPGEGQPGAEQNPPADQPPPGPDLSFIPADFVKDGQPDLAGFSQHYQDMVAADAQRREAAATVPGAYDYKLPEGFTFEGLDVPEGFEVDLMTDDPTYQPLFGEMSELLKEIGAPATAGPQIAGMLAKYEAVREGQQFAAWREDMKALGTPEQAAARVSAVQRKIETMLPADQAAAIFSGSRISAAGIKALERLAGPRGFTTPPPTPSTPDLEGMTPFEKLKLANKQAESRR